MEDINLEQLKKLIKLYRETDNKEVLEEIIFLHTDYINETVSICKYEELEKDEIISIIVLSIINLANYLDLDLKFSKYKQELKRAVKREIYDEVRKIRVHSNDESYEYYVSQHKNGQEYSYSDTFFEDYIRSIIPGILEEELDLITDKEKFIIKSKFGIDCDKLTNKQIGELFGVSDERIKFIEYTIMRKLRNPKHAKRLEYLIK